VKHERSDETGGETEAGVKNKSSHVYGSGQNV